MKKSRRNEFGKLYFARFSLANNIIREPPILVIDSDNDPEDVIVCICTKHPKRTEFDIPIHLKIPSCIRTNKIHTIGRSQLMFPLEYQITEENMEDN